MVTVAFWNLKGLARAEIVGELVREANADVIFLAESKETESELISCLNKSPDRSYRRVAISQSSKVKTFSHYPDAAFHPVYEEIDGRLTVHKLRVDSGDLLLATVHLQSKAFWKEGSQSQEAVLLSQLIKQIEKDQGHQRTVLIGDLNMDPFELGMISSAGMHAVMSKQIALERSRKVSGVNYPFFYNPMWGLMGDHSPGPPGTFFHRSAEHEVYFWHTLDQVLLRPDILPYFHGDLRIIDAVGDKSLLRANGRPDQTVGSDHLPICLSLRI